MGGNRLCCRLWTKQVGIKSNESLRIKVLFPQNLIRVVGDVIRSFSLAKQAGNTDWNANSTSWCSVFAQCSEPRCSSDQASELCKSFEGNWSTLEIQSYLKYLLSFQTKLFLFMIFFLNAFVDFGEGKRLFPWISFSQWQALALPLPIACFICVPSSFLFTYVK